MVTSTSTVLLSSLIGNVDELGYEPVPGFPGLFYLVAGRGRIPVEGDEQDLICFQSDLTPDQLAQRSFHLTLNGGQPVIELD